MLGVIPLAAAVSEKQLRDASVVQIALDRGVGDVAQTLEDEGDLVLLDQFANLLDGLRRAVAVVTADQRQLAAIDAAAVVDRFEVREFGPPDGAVAGQRATVRHGLA